MESTGLFLLLGVCLVFAHTAYGQGHRVCYFSNVAQYRPEGGKFFPEDIDPSLCNYLVYHKAAIDNDCLMATFEWNDEDLYQRFNALKDTNPDLKTLLAVKRTQTTCSLSDKDNRLIFAEDSIDFLRSHNFDGLDLNFDVHDLDYPEFKADFVSLVQELRDAYDADMSGPTLLLIADVSAKKEEVDEYFDVPNLVPFVDWVGLETYDFRGPGNARHVNVTYNHAGLYGRSDDTEADSYLNLDAGTQYWIDQGADPAKLLVSVAAVSVGFVLANENCTDVGCPTTGLSQLGPYTREDGFHSFYETCLMYGSGQPDTRWDEEQRVPYTVAGNEWISHSNIASIEEKAQYVLDNDLGGWTMWTLDMDDFNAEFCGLGAYPVLTTLNQVTNPNFAGTMPLKKKN